MTQKKEIWFFDWKLLGAMTACLTGVFLFIFSVLSFFTGDNWFGLLLVFIPIFLVMNSAVCYRKDKGAKP